MSTLKEAAQQALEAYDQHEPLAVVMDDLRAALNTSLADADKEAPCEQEQIAEHGIKP